MRKSATWTYEILEDMRTDTALDMKVTEVRSEGSSNEHELHG